MTQKEVERLRKLQAKAVMPKIGPLLDAFDGVPNDFISEMDEHASDLLECLREIQSAMEENSNGTV